MRICPKCGERIEDQFESCWKCSVPPEQVVPDAPTKESPKPNEQHTGPSFFSAVRCTLLASVASALLTVVLLMVRPPEGNGYMSQGGAEIFSTVGLLIFSFPVCWFPSMIIGFALGRKTFTKSQRNAHYFVTAISALAFVLEVVLVTGVMIHH